MNIGKNNPLFKILTLFVSYLLGTGIFYTAVFAQVPTISESNQINQVVKVLVQENPESHLRWNLYCHKRDIVFTKKGQTFFIKTLNKEVFSKLKRDISKISVNNNYIKSIDYDNSNAFSQVIITLTSPYVQTFNFYRDRQLRHVLDFWIDEDVSKRKVSALESGNKIAGQKKNKQTIQKTSSSRSIASIRPVSAKSTAKNANITAKKVNKSLKLGDAQYRDFRYGASFIWNYEPLIDELKKDINLKRKTAEYFYPIEDRPYQKNDIEAHLQLSINFYRDKKWGLMYKSIKLFNEKYSDERYSDVNEYLKANAILRENMQGKNDISQIKMARNMYLNIASKTKNYELKKGIFKYLIADRLENRQYLEVLEFSKKLYVWSMENYDTEQSQKSAKMMFHSLAVLGQEEKLQQLLEEPTIKKLVPLQIQNAYKLYVLLKNDNVEQAVRYYNSIEAGLVPPINPTIVYNAAEAMFRSGKYEKAITLYDEFIKNHSKMTHSSHARLRMALCYDLLGKKESLVGQLYLDAINMSSFDLIRYEAQLRFVALTSIRKYRPTDKDIEMRVFLKKTFDNKLLTMKKNVSDKLHLKNVKKLLWLVRLRTFLADGDYNKALAYLNAIPLSAMNPEYAKVFEADGAEVVYGLLNDHYQNGEYSRLIKLWEAYKDKYISKVAMSPFLNFVVGHTFIKLSFYNAFEKHYKIFEKLKKNPVRTYPIWVPRKKHGFNINQMLSELLIAKNLHLKNWDSMKKDLTAYLKIYPDSASGFYYAGILAHQQKLYTNSVKNFEEYITRKKEDESIEINDLAVLFKCYTESLYNLGDKEKYLKVSRAIINDLDKINMNKYIKEVVERIAYMGLEIGSNLDQQDISEIEYWNNDLQFFKSQFPNSSYMPRLNYLWSSKLIKNGKEGRAIDILKQIVDNQQASSYLREMAKSELALLNIKNKTI